MAQVIEVRFLNPDSQETLHDCMTLASSHEEAIKLALSDFSSGIGVMKEVELLKDNGFFQNGSNSCWQYLYSCTIADDEYDREMLAILFAQYPEEATLKKHRQEKAENSKLGYKSHD